MPGINRKDTKSAKKEPYFVSYFALFVPLRLIRTSQLGCGSAALHCKLWARDDLRKRAGFNRMPP